MGPERSSLAWPRGAPVLLWLAIAVACAGAVLLVFQSHLTFFGDDWKILLERRGSNPSVFLDPHNDHIVILLVFIYKGLLATVGMSSSLPFSIASTFTFLLSAVLVFVYLRLRVGDWPALLGTILLLFLGAAWIDLLWSFQIVFSGSIAAGLGALLLLERNDRSGDLIALGLLVVSTAFSELGVAFVIGALVSIALGPRPQRTRLYVVLVPLVLYAVWFLGWGHKGPDTITLHNLLVSPKYVFDAVSQAMASLLGLATPLSGDGSKPVGLVWGHVLFLVAVVLAVWRVRRVGRISAGLWTALAMGGAFWFLAALNAYQDLRTPTNGRYQFPGAVFVLLIAAELLRGVRMDRRVLAGATVVTTAAVVSGLFFLHDGYRRQKTESDLERSRLAALEIARPNLSPDTPVALELFTGFTAGAYFGAADAFGSPAYTESELASRSEADRLAADQFLASTLGIKLGATPLPRRGGGARCLPMPASSNGTPAVALGPGDYSLTAPVTQGAGVRLGRFADLPAVDLGEVLPRQRISLRLPPDRSARPWRLAAIGSGPVIVCGAPHA